MTLADHLWQSTLLAGVAALLAIACRRTSARTRHSIWLVASVKFLVPLSLLVAAGRLIGLSLSTLPTSSALQWLDRSLAFWRFDVAVTPSDAVGAPTTGMWLLVVWGCGAATLAAHRIADWRRLSLLVRQSSPLTDGREADALDRAVRQYPRAAHLALVQHESHLEPGVLGVLCPTLLWPAGLTDRLSDRELDAIMAHEACHVERRDNFAALVQVVVETAFWFHPVVWWIGARLVDERERACDEEVLSMGTDNRSYAEGIVKVCGFCLRAPAAFVAGVGGASLNERVETILSWRASMTPSWTRVIPVALALVAVGVPIAAGCASTTHAAGQGGTQVYKPGKDIKAPVLVSEVKPNYSAAAMSAKIQGGVMLQAIVLTDGTVGDVKVVKSLDTVHGLDDEAIKAIKQWRFTPGTKDNKPVAVQVDVEMTFTLK